MPQRTLILLLTMAFLAVLSTCQVSFGQADFSDKPAFIEAPSILRPAQAGVPTYRYTIARIDPTLTNNFPGKDYPGFRGPNQLVIYTPQSGVTSTNTNAFGAEAIVVNNRIQRVQCCNSVIPADGFVISGHGAAGQWIKSTLKPGAFVQLEENPGGGQVLTANLTPQVYLHQVETALGMAVSASEKMPDNQPSDRYQQALETAKQCYVALKEMADNTENPDLTQLKPIATEAMRCEHLANQAFYKTVATHPDEFRGIWIRPNEKTPEQVEAVLKTLETLGIQDVFLETYYQGKTIYPSQVMIDYGLAPQHPRFKNTDPLALWVETAHRHGMRVHAWTQVFFAGNKDENFETYGPILTQYPQWANVKRDNACATPVCKTSMMPHYSQVEEGHFFLDPANPEVCDFLQKLLREMVSTYELDGVNLDYIRYPSSLPLASGRFASSTWGYTSVARQAFMHLLMAEEAARPKTTAVTKKPDGLRYDPLRLIPNTSPQSLWGRWVGWRQEQINSFVSTASSDMRTLRPGLKITAVVFPKSSADSLSQIKLQNWPLWVANGWVDALTPIGLYPTPEGLYQDSLSFREATQDKVPVYIGVFGAYNRLTPAEFIAQIEAVHQAGMPGLVIFENSRLSQPYRDALKAGPFRN